MTWGPSPRRLAASSAVLAALAGCATGPSTEQLELLKDMMPDTSKTRVETAVLRPSRAVLTLQLPGEVEGGQDSLLAAANGGIVEEVRVAEGQAVDEGDVLVVIDRAMAAAQVAQAEAQLDQARADLARAESMGEFAVGAEVATLGTQVKVAEASLRVARTQLERTVVRAPFSGIVGGIAVDVGEMAGPGAPVVRLVQLDPVTVNLSVSDRDVVALRSGLEARVRTQAMSDIRIGAVSHVSPVADLSTRSFLVDVTLPNPEHALLPGMIALVEVDRVVDEDAVVLPQDWIVTKLDAYGVYVADGDVARWREVTLGDVVRGQVVVTSGVQAGDRVVMVGQNDLVDGDPLLVSREGWCCEEGRAVFTSSTAAAR